jgi:DNA-binding CsgD family transcriptional regulator
VRPARGGVGAALAGRPRVLEREHEIAALATAIQEAAAGAGSVVLAFGEAGIGKSSLVGAVPGVLPPQGRLLVGYCDDLATPRTLGPFRDLIGSVGVELAGALRAGGDRDRVLDALHAELSSTGSPTVLAVEDVHWADEATLDALCYLVRRIAGLPAVLLLTYRDDDLGVAHPLQRVLGEAARGAAQVRRLPLARLSQAAVWQLAAASRLDPHDVYVVTGGNPFFVIEVLASGDTGDVPPTIVDAVLARARSLDANTQKALEQLAVVPSAVDRWLLDSLLPDGVAGVVAAEQRGLLDVAPNRVDFRHELIRRAIADSLPGARSVELNRRVLEALAEREGSDLSRIVHHAARAGDVDAIIRYGPQAAADASRAGSHREAAAHLRLVLEHRQRFEPGERAMLLGRYAIECYTVGDMLSALAAQQDAVDLRRTLDDPRALGVDLRWLSRLCWTAGEPDRMDESADEAVAVLETAGDDRLLALALSNKSQLHMLAHRNQESIRVGERALTLARAVGDPAILSQALNNVGTARWHLGDREGHAMLTESLRVAQAAGAIEDVCRAYANLTWALLQDLRLDEASRYFAAAIELAEDSEHLAYLYHFYANRAALGLATGDWDQAVSDAEFALNSQPPPRAQTRCPALGVLARIMIRRGQFGGERLLSEAWEFAERTRELQHTSPLAVIAAEAAWLRGDRAAMAPLLEPVYADVCRIGAVTLRAELEHWLIKAGHQVTPAASGHPYALQAAGRWREAAAAWREAGCRYEHAAALTESPDPEDLLAALAELDALGAEPLARHVRRRLRDLGVPRVPRGPVATTRGNPAGLTDRQLQVARLLAEGLTNAAIAYRLMLSVRTVDNHVAAVLDKLGVRNRRDITARIADLGLSVDAT